MKCTAVRADGLKCQMNAKNGLAVCVWHTSSPKAPIGELQTMAVGLAAIEVPISFVELCGDLLTASELQSAQQWWSAFLGCIRLDRRMAVSLDGGIELLRHTFAEGFDAAAQNAAKAGPEDAALSAAARFPKPAPSSPKPVVGNGDRILSGEAAALLGISLNALWRSVREKKVPHWRIGRNIRFSREALEAFIAAGGSVE